MKFLRCKFKTLDTSGLMRELSDKEISKIRQLLNSFPNESRSTLVYRGVNEGYLVDRFSSNDVRFDEQMIMGKLFFFGDKSKNFLRDRFAKATKENSNLKDIEDCSLETGKYIFDKYKKLKKSNCNKVLEYIEKTEDMAYFSHPGNRVYFARKIEEGGQAIRDYYLETLHTAGRIGVSAKSFHISTSTDYKVARGFTGSKVNSYVIVYIHRRSVELENQNRVSQFLKEQNLPKIDEAKIYPEQKEKSIRAGMYPHNILAAYNCDTRTCIVNPHIFNKKNIGKNLSENQLYIDQSNFGLLVKEKTNYHGWNETYDHMYFIEGVRTSTDSTG